MDDAFRKFREDNINKDKDRGRVLQELQLDLRKEQEKRLKEKADRDAKSGGKVLGEPSKEQVNAVLDLIEQEKSVINYPCPGH